MKSLAVCVLGVGFCLQHAAYCQHVPFLLPGDKEVVVAGSINGQPAHVLVDTGSNMTLVSPNYASSGIVRRVEVFGIHAVVTRQMNTFQPTVSIGHDQIRVKYAFENDMSFVSCKIGLDVDVLIGSELYLKHAVGFNYQQHQLDLDTPAPPFGKGVKQRIDTKQLPLVQLKIRRANGKWVKASFLIDTGSEFSISLHPWFVAKHPDIFLATPVSTVADRAIGYGGDAALSRGKLRGVQMGDLELDQEEADVELTERESQPWKHVAGSLGNVFLSRFYLYLDYPHKQITVATIDADSN